MKRQELISETANQTAKQINDKLSACLLAYDPETDYEKRLFVLTTEIEKLINKVF